MVSYTSNAVRRGAGPHKMSEDGSQGMSLRLPSTMIAAIDELIHSGAAHHGNRQNFVRAAIDNYLQLFQQDLAKKQKSLKHAASD